MSGTGKNRGPRAGRYRYGILACTVMAATLSGAQEMRVTVVDKPDVAQSNRHYNGNRPPLLPSPLIKLPLGAVQPEGWLRKQLELTAEGFFGHLTEISPFCREEGNAWLDPEGIGHSGWEEVPYWLRGYVPLAYLLGDRSLIEDATPWIEAAIASQTDFGYFGPQSNLFAPVHPAVPGTALTTADGTPGLQGEYFEGTEFNTLKGRRVDAVLDFDWGENPPMEGLPQHNWSARWTGFISVPQDGEFTFSLYSDDGARMWVGDEALVDNWRVQAPMTLGAQQTVAMEANRKYPIRVEYFQGGGGAALRLGVKRPGATYTPGTMSPDFMPNMSMLFALRHHYEYTGDTRILDLMKRYFQWQLLVPDDKFFSGGWQFPRNGDNLDSVYWLYNITGDAFLLELGEKLMRTGASWMSGNVRGGHNVDFSQGWRKPAQFYVQGRDQKYLAAAEGNFDSMYGIYGQVPGGMFGGDEFSREGYIGPRQSIETCGTAEMMLSQQILLRITGDLKWADRCENAAFNSFPAHFTHDYGALRYLTAPNQINSDKRCKYPVYTNAGAMQWMNPHDHRCCQHNGGMGWPFFAESLWHATPGNGLAAVLYAPCRVKATVGEGVEVDITQQTFYPFDGRVRITLSTPQAVRFPLYLRVPGWCDAARFAVNGTPVPVEAVSGSYVRIDRTWADGDRVAIDFPMEVKATVWEANKDSVSLNWGALTFSVKIAEQYERSGGTEAWPAWEIHPGSPWNYGLVLDPQQPADTVEVVRRPWPASDQPFKWDEAPVEMRVRAQRIPNWTETIWGAVDEVQQSPVRSSEPVETIAMIPMGAGRLRMSALPVIGEGDAAREWRKFVEPVASATHPPTPMSALWDGKVPSASNDRSVPHFSWWPKSRGIEYVIWQFDEPRTVRATEVYWYIDEDATTSPEWWKLYYRDGEEWKEVRTSGAFGLEKDQFNEVAFEAVTTTAIKLEAQLGGRSGGISEWRVK